MENWSDKIRSLESRGWSLVQIGHAIDLSSSAVSDIKHRRTKEPQGMSAVALHNLALSDAMPPSANDDHCDHIAGADAVAVGAQSNESQISD